MKKSSILVITIPLVIVGCVIAAIVVLRVMSTKQSVPAAPVTTAPAVIPPLSTSSGKPTVGFGNLQQANPVSDLQQQYDASTDDGGTSGLDALQQQASSL